MDIINITENSSIINSDLPTSIVNIIEENSIISTSSPNNIVNITEDSSIISSGLSSNIIVDKPDNSIIIVSGLPGPPGPTGGALIGGYSITLSNIVADDLLSFNGTNWANLPASYVGDGGNF